MIIILLSLSHDQHTRLTNQEPLYYDTYNNISKLVASAAGQSATSASPSGEQPAAVGSQHSALPASQSLDDWLDSIKMSRYKENFKRHQLNTLHYVARLNQDDLSLIGIQNSQHLRRLMGAIAALRSTTSIGQSAEGYLV